LLDSKIKPVQRPDPFQHFETATKSQMKCGQAGLTTILHAMNIKWNSSRIFDAQIHISQ